MKMYEIVWKYEQGFLTDFKIKPVTITRHSTMPGCTLPSVSGIDEDGRKFNATMDMFYDSYEAALAAVKNELRVDRINQESIRDDAVKQIAILNQLLKDL